MAKKKETISAEEVGELTPTPTTEPAVEPGKYGKGQRPEPEAQPQLKNFEDQHLRVLRTSVQMVTEFHRTMGHPIGQYPAFPPRPRQELRFALLEEELKELIAAAAAGDLVGVADGLCDLQYILDGTFVEFGLAEKKEALFAEVQRSNMSKSCETEHEAQLTVKAHTPNEGPCHYKEIGGRFVVYRDSDNKVLKSINYSKVNLRDIIYPPAKPVESTNEA